jgi:hypothetical protein
MLRGMNGNYKDKYYLGSSLMIYCAKDMIHRFRSRRYNKGSNEYSILENLNEF